MMRAEGQRIKRKTIKAMTAAERRIPLAPVAAAVQARREELRFKLQILLPVAAATATSAILPAKQRTMQAAVPLFVRSMMSEAVWAAAVHA
jgi:hypothetical protein